MSSLKNITICSKCIYDETISNISFDEEGVCNYCHQVASMKEQYGTGREDGKLKLDKIIQEIKLSGKGKKYDCAVGVSGGTDSSFLLAQAIEWGLKPLAVHYDNTWNTHIATENIRKVTTALDVDLFTHVVDNREIDDLKKSFLLSGVIEFDTDTDIALVQVMRSTAAKFGIKYILEGHSFTTEGISPVGSNYFDGGYIKDIHKRFGSIPINSYPNLTFWQFMKWTLIYRQKFIRPLWYIDYDKDKAKRWLAENTGWQNYEGHHLENRASAYAHTIWIPQRYNLDYRNLTLAASAREGKITREQAIEIYSEPVKPSQELIDYVKKRTKLTDEDYVSIINGPKRNFRHFKTYKKRFEILKPLFFILAKLNLVPFTFYTKYCFPIEEEE